VSIASAGLRDGTGSGQFVMRMRRTAAIAVVHDLGRELLRWRHRFIINRWEWQMPSGYAGQAEDPTAAAREAGEETGLRLPDPARAGTDVPAHDRKCRFTPGSLCCTPDKRRGLSWICS
jgi:8-oxo-dGTP pyrophosphatase MutT (NUDIX family)